MEPEPSMERLMAQYQEGDLAAAAALVKQVSPRLYRFFLAQSFSRRHADDLLQETWMRIHKVRHTYRPGQPFLPWLYAIARNVRVDHFRKNQRFETREQSLDEVAERLPASEPDSDTSNLEALLATLPESQREVIVMLKVSEMSLEEVARATSSTVGSVKQKVHRAYQKLRELGIGRLRMQGTRGRETE
jgi:RNA polymerase sigma-70 factor (ECF subfamily)